MSWLARVALRACCLLVLLTGAGFLTAAQAAPPFLGKPSDLVVVDYHPVSKTKVANSTYLYDYVYRVDVKNTTAQTAYDVTGSVKIICAQL